MDLIETNRAKQLVCFFGESLTDEIVALIKPYQNLPLECDGMTRVITYLLSRAGVPHKTMLGTISVKGMGEFTPHYWIELVDGSIVDYKSRMWFSDNASIPQGVFDPKGSPVSYHGRPVEMGINQFIFDVLTAR